jgi:hypothetical protein
MSGVVRKNRCYWSVTVLKLVFKNYRVKTTAYCAALGRVVVEHKDIKGQQMICAV